MKPFSSSHDTSPLQESVPILEAEQYIPKKRKTLRPALNKPEKIEFDFAKHQEEVQSAGITSSREYSEQASQRRWISVSTLKAKPEWTTWDDFLKRIKRIPFNYAKLQEEVQSAGITSGSEYSEQASQRKWTSASTLTAKPEWTTWDDFLKRTSFDFAKLQAEVQSAGITSSREYIEQAPQRKWISVTTLKAKPEWTGWDNFLGRDPSSLILRSTASSFLESVENNSIETEAFRKLMSLFGSARTLDLLYAFHPEWKKLPVEYIKGEMAKYLGDYMVVRSGNIADDVEYALPFLGEKTFQESLFTVIKEDIISKYGAKKKHNQEKEDRDIIEEYLAPLRDRSATFDNKDFKDVMQRVEEYCFSILNDFHKPDNIVTQLKSGRIFPDLNQMINIKEVKDEKRVLIGDEMGMGKSGSAILSKEYLGVGTALVVVPANVIDTWKRYLSDDVGPNGEQLGYFKKGKAPSVLKIESLSDIAKISDRYDYVIISHDRFTEEYAEKLKTAPCEMVIIDESHKFKNLDNGVRSEALLSLMEEYKKRDIYTVLLSGTPVPNKIKDIAITLKLLYPEEFGQMDNKVLSASIIGGDLINLRDLLFKKTQMKKHSIELPEKIEQNTRVTFSEEEQELYELLLDDDELTATGKLSALRLFCLNPQKIFPDRNIRSSKVEQTEKDVKALFDENDKVVFFVNGYVDGVIRGENSALSQLDLPEGTQVRIIDGQVSAQERAQIEKDMKYLTSGKMLLVVNGGAADVGVDFSSADAVYYYNEPWSKFDKMQQTARVYRPGLAHDITVDTSIIEGSIEEGIHYYLEMKYKAVQKLLEGVPLSELETSILLMDEKVTQEVTIDGDKGLAEEWLQSPMNRLNKFFGATKEIGEKKFKETFLNKYGEEYAEYYADMGSRGFQANTGRFVSSLIEKYRKEKGVEGEMTIVDLASGPEMLARRVSNIERDNVFSLDINHHHFKEGTGRQVVAGFSQLPIRSGSVDYLNLSLAFHYSTFRPSKNEYERLHVVKEIARALKVGGRATINLVYSQEFKNNEMLRELLQKMGLVVVEDVTGKVSSGNQYKSYCLTFEKTEEVNLDDVMEKLKNDDSDLLDGLKLVTNSKTKIRRGQEVIKDFMLNGEEFETNLNTEDSTMLREQEEIQEEARLLISDFKGVENIPRNEILKRGFLRYQVGSKCKLVKKGPRNNAFIHVY